ncbi:MAG: endonuclease NucS [Candidatus Omnitrophica bacterium]|nr:endonuclease NucS [Candidatus Omnitrophota bacterium]MCM8793946.1 endonuclease NucS [Candidatus Omnitrophota bacterium]
MDRERPLFPKLFNHKNNKNSDPPLKEEIMHLLIEGISNLERGLRILDRNLIITKNPLDILAVDILGELVIIELETGGDEVVILRALEHFDWILNNLNSIVQKYSREKIDITLAPRIVIIAGNFNEDFVRKLSYVNTTRIELYEYELKNEEGISRLNLKPYALSVLSNKKIELSRPALEDLINFIQPLPLRQLCQKIISEVRKKHIGALVDTSRGFIEVQDKGRILLRIYPQNHFFWISFSPRGKWQGIKIDNMKGEEEILSRLPNKNN